MCKLYLDKKENAIHKKKKRRSVWEPKKRLIKWVCEKTRVREDIYKLATSAHFAGKSNPEELLATQSERWWTKSRRTSFSKRWHIGTRASRICMHSMTTNQLPWSKQKMHTYRFICEANLLIFVFLCCCCGWAIIVHHWIAVRRKVRYCFFDNLFVRIIVVQWEGDAVGCKICKWKMHATQKKKILIDFETINSLRAQFNENRSKNNWKSFFNIDGVAYKLLQHTHTLTHARVTF